MLSLRTTNYRWQRHSLLHSYPQSLQNLLPHFPTRTTQILSVGPSRMALVNMVHKTHLQQQSRITHCFPRYLIPLCRYRFLQPSQSAQICHGPLIKINAPSYKPCLLEQTSSKATDINKFLTLMQRWPQYNRLSSCPTPMAVCSSQTENQRWHKQFLLE